MIRKQESELNHPPSIIEAPIKEESETTTTTTTMNVDMDMGMDRISRLPDSLLCHILSFLPTRTSMATGVLSRRWRHLWKDLQVLDFPYYPDGGPFINAVLPQRSPHHIQKFHLSCNLGEIEDSVAAWIRAASTGPYLQDLYLYLYEETFFGIVGEVFRLPDEVFTCTSLVSLNLKDQVYLCPPSSVHLPSLKNLKLTMVSFVDLDEILSGCPVLETLKLTLHGGDFPAIHMPHSLKSLTFEVDIYGVIEHLEIDTPSLEYLLIKLYSRCLGTLVGNFPRMVEAYLDIWPENENAGWVPEVLRALCKTKFLVLEDSTIKCLFRAPALDFPEFSCLLNLEVGSPHFNWSFLNDVLHNCHMLRVLKIDNHRNWEELSDQTLPYNEHSGWTPPTCVPDCVISQLRIFEYRGCRHSAVEHAFIAFLLQRGLALEIMSIFTAVKFGVIPNKEDDICKELSILPRGSISCQLTLDFMVQHPTFYG